VTQAVHQCASNFDWREVEVPSSTDPGKKYSVSIPPWGDDEDITCDCPGYLFRGSCRHTKAALERVCGWTSESKVPQTAEQARDHICPRCGGPTVLVEEKNGA